MPYILSCADREIQKLRHWRERARLVGRESEFVEMVSRVYDRLTNDPLVWGDPLYRLHRLDLLICRGRYRFLQVYYGVDRAKRIVYVKEFALVPGELFDQEE